MINLVLDFIQDCISFRSFKKIGFVAVVISLFFVWIGFDANLVAEKFIAFIDWALQKPLGKFEDLLFSIINKASEGTPK